MERGAEWRNSRAYHSSIVADGRAIIWGGLTANGASNSVDIIDLNNHIYSHRVAVEPVDGTILQPTMKVVFIIGVENESGKINSMDVFTLPPTGVQWLNGEPTIQARENMELNHIMVNFISWVAKTLKETT